MSNPHGHNVKINASLCKTHNSQVQKYKKGFYLLINTKN